jgi:hypothetical protein
MRASVLCAIAAGLSLLLSVRSGVAQTPGFNLAQTYRNPAPSPEAQFGYSVAALHDNVLIGAPFDDVAGTDAGAVFLFDGKTGNLLRTFRSPNPVAGDWFGIAVSAVGNNVLVGALGDDTGARDAGAAYLFDGGSGALLHTFQKANPTEGDWFGGAVAAMGNNVLVGAPLDHASGKEAGAAYLFEGTTGALLRTFQKQTPQEGDWFGVSLAASSSRVLVGAMLDDTGAKDTGAAYLFDAATGGLLQTIRNPNPGDGDWFGVAVAAVGDNFLVGAPFSDVAAPDAGAAYLFDGTSGALNLRFPAKAAPAGAQFGRSIAVNGRSVAIGAPGDSAENAGGATYLFIDLSSTPLLVLRNPSAAAKALFGFSVALGDTNVVVAAPQENAEETHAGAVYEFRSTQ